MPAPAKQMPPAELAALEHAFAADPSSKAYRPLTEAYLSLGRFMEAMVVCKKGVKAHPADPAPRVLLARIHAAQGKDRKALEELAAALQANPKHAESHRMSGLLLLKMGEKDPGVAALRRAWESDPADPETLDAMKKWGLTFAPPEPPPPPKPPPPPPPRAAAGNRSPAAPAPGPAAAAAPATPEPVEPEQQREGTGERKVAYSEELASRYGTREYTIERKLAAAGGKKLSGPIIATLGLGAVLLLVLGAWLAVGQMRKARAVEIEKLLRQTRELLDKDSYASYQEAAKLCERILDRDPDSLGGHAYLAYIDAVRFAEHGESERLREEAKKHLEAVKAAGQHSHAYAAAAYLAFQAGDVKGAIEELRKVMAGPEGGSALLHGVLGVIEMQSGDLDAARQDLSIARQIAPGDVRVTQMLAEQWRRRGQGYEVQAVALYDAALTRLAPDHVPSLLGKAQILLDANRPDEAMKRIGKVLDMGAGASPRQVALAHMLRGAVLHAHGKTAEGDAAEQQALALDPSNADIHDLIGRRRLRSGDAAGAADEFQKATQLEPGRIGFYVDLASAFMQRSGGGAKQAIAALEKASGRAGNARVTKLLGDAYRADGDLDRARAAYEKAMAMEKTYPEARVALARVYRERKEYAKALDELGLAVKEYGESGGAATAYVEIAAVEEARGAGATAVENAYANAMKADPQSCAALFWLGRSRAEKRSRSFNRTLAVQMLGDYVRYCPRGAQSAEVARLLTALR